MAIDTPPAPGRNGWPLSWSLVLFALGYTLATSVGNGLATPLGFAIFWPASGVALAGLLSFRRRHWPFLLTIIVAANLAVVALAGHQRSTVAFVFGLVDAAEAVLAASVVRWLVQGPVTMATLREVVVLVVGAAAGANAVTATIATGIASLLGVGSTGPFAAMWFVSNGVGMITVTPIVLSTRAAWHEFKRLVRQDAVEFTAQMVAVVAVALVAFGLVEIGGPLPRYGFLVLPVMLWPALRFGTPAAAMAALLAVGTAVISSAQGRGPLVDRPDLPAESLILANQLFMAVIALSALLPAAVISEQRRLRREGATYRVLSEQARDPILLIRLSDQRVVQANAAAIQVYGYPPADLLGMTVADLRAPGSRPSVGPMLQEAYASPDGRRFETCHLKRDGSEVPVEVSSRGIWLEKERFVLSVVRDISERKRAERQILYLNRLYAVSSQVSQMVVRAGDRVALASTACRIAVDVGNFRAAWVGLVGDGAPGVAPVAVFGEASGFFDDLPEPLASTEGFSDPIREAIDGGRPAVVNDLLADSPPPWRRRAARFGVGSAAFVPLYVEGRLAGVFALCAADAGFFTLSEMSLVEQVGGSIAFGLEALHRAERTRVAEEATEAANLRFRAVFEHASEGILLLSDDQFVECNPRAELIYGRQRAELLGRRPWDVSPPLQRGGGSSEEIARPLLAAAMQGQQQFFEWTHQRPDGTLLDTEVVLNRVSLEGGDLLIALVRDITDRRELEAQLLQAQKMEAIGRLAGGIAHDFNNLLTVIQGYSETLADGLPDGDGRRQPLEEVLKATHRASGLTRQLLAFSRKQVLQPVLLDLNTVVAEMERLLLRIIGEDVVLRTELGAELPTVQADLGQVQQVLLNLAVNARDAMPHGGHLVIRTSLAEFDEEYARRHPDVTAGRYVALSVSDSGVGIPDEIRAQIFEPFFTTKPRDKGTGLGLATVYGIVRQSGGHLDFDSQVGVGTSFRVYFPAIEAPSAHPGSSKREEATRGSERVLLVEDDELVRGLVERMLTRAGHTVIATDGGRSAMAALERLRGSVDLVLTDIVMPEMSGRALADQVRKRYPSVRVLLMSGYTEDQGLRLDLQGEGLAFIAKPFTVGSLNAKVREVLDG